MVVVVEVVWVLVVVVVVVAVVVAVVVILQITQFLSASRNHLGRKNLLLRYCCDLFIIAGQGAAGPLCGSVGGTFLNKT